MQHRPFIAARPVSTWRPRLLVSLACLAASAPALGADKRAIEQRLRTVDVQGQEGDVYAIDVLAAPKLTTNIRLPEGFVAADVLCGGACIDAADVGSGQATGVANWIIDKRVAQQSIHVWPARLPGPGNPTSAFATNIYVATDEGRAYNISLRLLDLDKEKLVADAVVNIVNGAAKNRHARQIALQESCREQFREELRQEAHTSLFAALNGTVSCHRPKWRRPHRDGILQARIEQICRSQGQSSLLWVYYSLENRSSGPLQIDSVRLLAGPKSFQGESEEAGSMSSTLVLGKQRITGVAARRLPVEKQGLRDWRLDITPEPGDGAEPFHIDHIEF